MKTEIKIINESETQMVRSTIERVATPFNIYFLLVMTLCGAILVLVGVALNALDGLDHLSDATGCLVIGMVSFTLFFPWFTALYFARYFLQSVSRLEAEVASLRDQNK